MASVENIADIGVKLHITSGKTDIAPVQKAGKEIDNLAQSQKAAAFAGMNFNRVIQDSPYFFTSFNMGVMSIANNIGPLAESLARAKEQGQGFGSVLKGMFTGMGGWLTALNLAVAGIQMISMWMANSKRETDGAKTAADEYLEVLKRTAIFQKTGGQVQFTVDSASKAIKQLEAENKSIIESRLSVVKEEQKIVSASIGQEEKLNQLQKLREESAKKERELVNNDKKIAYLKEQLKAAREDVKMREELIRLGGQELDIAKATAEEQTKGQKDKNAELAKELELRKAILIEQAKQLGQPLLEAVTQEDLNRESKRLEEMRARVGILGAEAKLKAPIRPEAKGEEEGLDYGSAFTSSFSTTFTKGMADAWAKIFGEANSIAEMFIQSFVGSLISQLSGRLATSILGSTGSGAGIFGSIVGLFTGGAVPLSIGAGLAGMRGNDGRPLMADSATNVTLNIDGKKLMRVAVEPNFNKSIANMQRTKRL